MTNTTCIGFNSSRCYLFRHLLYHRFGLKRMSVITVCEIRGRKNARYNNSKSILLL